jgi:hypothetical protein
MVDKKMSLNFTISREDFRSLSMRSPEKPHQPPFYPINQLSLGLL